MSSLSIILFFLYTWGFGYGLGSLARESEDFLERNLMRIGIGLGAMLTLGLLLNLLRIPLDWKIFLSISILLILIRFYAHFKKGKNIFNPKNISISIFPLLMLVLFSISFYMYAKGAFSYPYLEDDDSWSHSMGVKYVSMEKTVFEKTSVGLHYIDPYPPVYEMLLGIMHQTSNSVYWTLKFFNALIVSLSIVFFYFFAKVFTNSSKKAFFSTFALFAVPAFLSHFIWAISITMPLFFISFYSVEKIKDDKKWLIIAAIVIAATLTSSPTHSTYFGLFFIIYFIARALAERKFLLHEFLAGFLGMLLSFLLWWLPMIIKRGVMGTLYGVGLNPASSLVAIGGTADRAYKISEFIFAKKTNMINNPIGIGLVLSILTVIGLIFLIIKYKETIKKEGYYKFVLLLWFVFSLYAVNAAKFPVKLSPFRAWMLLAIPVSLLSGEAINLIENFAKGLVKSITKSNLITTGASLLIIGTLFYGIIITSFIQKYTVNTALWPPGAFWTSNDEIKGYLWLKDNIPTGTKVFTFSNNGIIMGLDKFTCHWCENVRSYQTSGFNETADENYNWLKNESYRYIIIDGQAAQKFGANETNKKIQSFISSGKFRPVFTNNGLIIFEILQ
ncbi:hypothetical protein J4458_05775 [Candidatus Woesearchaeota archaeon]|nr:hypothetical protein [Candidatus Woesearchaeota archaeon]